MIKNTWNYKNKILLLFKNWNKTIIFAVKKKNHSPIPMGLGLYDFGPF
jgi:hypothetical protein